MLNSILKDSVTLAKALSSLSKLLNRTNIRQTEYFTLKTLFNGAKRSVISIAFLYCDVYRDLRNKVQFHLSKTFK
jgi:hypothetical protein